MTANSHIVTDHPPSLRDRAIHEFQQLAAITAYLYVCFGALIILKAAVLRAHGVDFLPWGLALIKALILAKFMMIGHALRLGGRLRSQPLIWPTLYRSAVFLVVLVALTVIEEAVVGLMHGRPIIQSIGEMFDGNPAEAVATCFILLLILIPYFAVRTLGEALGGDRLRRMFLVEPPPMAQP